MIMIATYIFIGILIPTLDKSREQRERLKLVYPKSQTSIIGERSSVEIFFSLARKT